MDALKTRYGINKVVQNAARPNYMYYIMRKGAKPLDADCPICRFENSVGVVAAVDVSKKRNEYQLCNSNRHQFYWNSPPPTVVLPDRPPAPQFQRDPRTPLRGCSEHGCKCRLSNKCANRMCLQSCLQWAMEKYDEGYSPLDLCADHRSEIEKWVKKALDEAIGAPEDPPQNNEWEPYIIGEDGNILPQQAVPIPVPPTPQPLQRLRRAPPPEPAPQVAQPAQPQQPVPARPRRGALAQPVAPLPAALALGVDPYQAGDVRMQRQRVLQTLQRTTREESADAMTRCIRVSMWLSLGEYRIGAVTNSKASRDCFVPSDHPTIIDFFKTGDTPPRTLQLYDWESKEWTTSGPEVPLPLAGRTCVLIRDIGMSDDGCANLHTLLEEDVAAVGNVGAETKSGAKRKLGGGVGSTGTKQRTVAVKTEAKTSRPLSSQASSPPLSSPPSPEPSQPPRKKRRMNAQAKSWIMRESYKFVSEALVKVEFLRSRKGYDLEKSIARAFGSNPLPKTTFKRHYSFYLAVDDKIKTEWEINQQDRLWSFFWDEFYTKTEKGDADGEEEDEEDE